MTEKWTITSQLHTGTKDIKHREYTLHNIKLQNRVNTVCTAFRSESWSLGRQYFRAAFSHLDKSCPIWKVAAFWGCVCQIRVISHKSVSCIRRLHKRGGPNCWYNIESELLFFVTDVRISDYRMAFMMKRNPVKSHLIFLLSKIKHIIIWNVL